MNKRDSRQNPYIRHKAAVAETNLYLMKWITLGACFNMTALSVGGPFMGGFSGAELLYIVSAVLTGSFFLFSNFCLKSRPNLVLPLFYGLLAGLCAYAGALSCFYYPDIHGVTIIGIFVLVPMLILDKTWRVNLIFLLLFAAICVVTFLRKPLAIAIDDAATCGAFLIFGMLIGVYLRKIRINAIIQQSETERQRDYDVLTGLPNRRLLFEILGKIDAKESSDDITGVFMIDVDDFKDYNDIHGHQAGDACLKDLGIMFQKFAQENGCRIYRYGGEEFLGLWQGRKPEDMISLGRALVARVQAERHGDKGVTISLGYAEKTGDTSTQRLISMADNALYEAKRLGKNRVVGYETQSGSQARTTYRQRK